MRHFFSLILATMFLLPACRSGRSYTSRPARGSAGAVDEALDVKAAVFHGNDTVSRVFVKIENENLLYKRPDTSGHFYAHLRVASHLMLQGNPRKVIDSSSVQIFDRGGVNEVPLHAVYAEFRLDALFGYNYLLAVEVFDVNRRTHFREDFNVYKASRFKAQNFLVKYRDSVAFGNHFQEGQVLQVTYADPRREKLAVDCFFKTFGPAPPPFSVKPSDPLKYKPDSSFVLSRNDRQFEVTMPHSGFYHMKAELSQDNGLTLLVFDESFPGVSSSEEMISCSRYIMSQEEFDKCRNASDPKKAIDEFWLNIGGSNERARELLRRYYGRVKEANRNYTSYMEGWKSDRGMIYIIFGAPVNIYKSRKDEIWVYGNEANPATLRFVFNKTENPFSDNDYIMERSQFYKELWHSAVDYWRQGRVYTNRAR